MRDLQTPIVSDAAIADLIAERKILPSDWMERLARFRRREDRNESQFDLIGERGTPFRIIVRQSRLKSDDFSIVLIAVLPEIGDFHLLRYDGGNHSHRNRIEGTRIGRKPHIHMATERYQTDPRRLRSDGYAEETDRYSDLRGAWRRFFEDLNPQCPDEYQTAMLPDMFTGE